MGGRLLDYLNEGACDYPEDIARLRSEIPELRLVSSKKVEEMYRDFSDDLYSAGWLNLDDSAIESFRRWLL